MEGKGTAKAGSGAFNAAGDVSGAHRRVRRQDEPGGADGGGARGVLCDGAQRRRSGGRARRPIARVVTATVTADKGDAGIKIMSSKLTVVAYGLKGHGCRQFAGRRERSGRPVPGVERLPRVDADHGGCESGVRVLGARAERELKSTVHCTQHSAPGTVHPAPGTLKGASMRTPESCRWRTLLAGAALAAVAVPLQAQTPIESSAEVRFQLDLKVPDAALKALLPQGFTLNVAAQGAAKDCNLRAIFIDRLRCIRPDGKPIGKGSNRLVYLAAPVRDASGANAQLIIGGLTADPGRCARAFRQLSPCDDGHGEARRPAERARTSPKRRTGSSTAASGERLEMHITFERGVANRNQPSDTKFYSAKNPAFYQISRQEQVLDILRNVTTNPPDRVKQYSFKGSGGSFAKLFDGTEQTVSWDNILWMMRTVSVP